MAAEFNHIPEGWHEMTFQEKNIWFSRHAVNYTREGEVGGIREDVPADVNEAYAAFLAEEKQ